MKIKLLIYGSFVAMYGVIIYGLISFYNKFKVIEPIIPQTEPRTIVPLPILIIFSVIVFIILLSIGAQILVAFWTWLKDHKTMIVYPFLFVAIGFAQLSLSIMEVVRAMIKANAQQFILNLSSYIEATETLVWYIIGGILVGAIGLGIEIYQKYTA